MIGLKSVVKKINYIVYKNYDNTNHQIDAFSILLGINFIFFFFVSAYISGLSQTHYFLRAIAFLICLVLVFRKKLFSPFYWFIPFFWYIAIIFCLPFFYLYFCLSQNFNEFTSVSFWAATTFLILIVDVLNFYVMLLLGSAFAVFIFFLIGKTLDVTYFKAIGILTNFVITLIIISIFSRNKQLLQMERLKGAENLIGIIAHELRTPLATIVNYLKVLKRRLLVDNKENDDFLLLKESILSIEDSTKYVDTTIDTLLNIFNNNVRQEKLEEIVSLIDVIDTIKQYIKIYAANVDFDIDIGNFEFLGNKLIMVHILWNIIKNAIYALKETDNNKIRIHSGRLNKDYNFIRIKDNGLGIPNAIKDHIFDRFFTTKPPEVGSGLGLYYVKKMIRLMGGEINVNSVYNEYSEFYIKLPSIKT